MNLLSTFVFCVCVRVYVCGFYNYLFFSHLSIVPCLLLLFLFYYFRAFFFVYLFVSSSSSSSVIWFFYFSLCFFFSFCSLFCPVTTRSLFLFFLSLFWQIALLEIVLPPFYLAIPRFSFHFRQPYSVFPPFFRVTKIIRRHVRVRGIERYEEEGFEGLGGRRVQRRDNRIQTRLTESINVEPRIKEKIK